MINTNVVFAGMKNYEANKTINYKDTSFDNNLYEIQNTIVQKDGFDLNFIKDYISNAFEVDKNVDKYANSKLDTSKLNIKNAKEDFEILKDGSMHMTFFPKSTNSFFSSYLSSQTQNEVSEASYRQSLLNLISLAEQILSYVEKEQGLDSKLHWDLQSYLMIIKSDVDIFEKNLANIYEKVQNYDGSKEQKDEILLEANKYTYGMQGSEVSLANFFDYAIEQIDGLDKDYIMQELKNIKGYRDSNSLDNGLTLMDGTQLSLDDNGNFDIKLSSSLAFSNLDLANLDMKNRIFNTLFSIFDNRENKMKENLSLKQDINLEEKAKNTKLNTKQSPLSELLNSKDL